MNASEKPKSLREVLDELSECGWTPRCQAAVEAWVLDALVRVWEDGWWTCADTSEPSGNKDIEGVARNIIEGREI